MVKLYFPRFALQTSVSIYDTLTHTHTPHTQTHTHAHTHTHTHLGGRLLRLYLHYLLEASRIYVSLLYEFILYDSDMSEQILSQNIDIADGFYTIYKLVQLINLTHDVTRNIKYYVRL